MIQDGPKKQKISKGQELKELKPNFEVVHKMKLIWEKARQAIPFG